MEMEDQYNISDLRQLMNGRPHFPTIPQPPELFSGHHHRNLTTGQPYDMIMMGRHEIITSGLHEFRSDSAATSNTSLNVTTPSNFNGGLDSETNTCFGGGGDGGTGRWPRQETLTLLEIRSRLDSKFKEANQKGPLWDEVSRIMYEEHGYQRSGKKCREKFENLYKYYKKTKEGKAGRQDGKHYRFFRQLEALYGETSNQVSIPESHFSTGTNHRHHSASNNNAPIQENYQEGYQSHYKHNNCDSLSLSQYSSEFDSSSSEDNDLSTASELMLDNDNSSDKRRKRRGSGRSNWRLKIKELIDSQMKKLMDKQEAWLEKLMKTLEQKERERNLREEEWRRLEGSRIDREQKFWARERAWIEARDSALFDALQKLTGKELKLTSSISEGGLNQNEEGSEILNNNNNNNNNNGKGETWSECEVNRLIELRANVELKVQQGGGEFSDDVMWEDIATKMASFGFDRSPLMLKEKWESINSYVVKKPNYDQFYGKKRKENSRGYNSNFNFQNHESSSIYNNTNNNNNNTNDHHHHGTYSYDHINEGSAAGIGRLQSSDGASPSDKHQKYNNNNNSNNSSSSNNVSNAVHDACFPFLMGNEGDHNLWDNYGSLKLNKGGQN